MTMCRSGSCPVTIVLAACALATSGLARAEGNSDDWRFSATLYGWLPTMSGEVAVPLDENPTVSFEMDPGDVLDALELTFQGAAEARKGRWGIATDLIYLDLSGSGKRERSFELGDQQVPATVQLKADGSLSGWVWTTDARYAVIDDDDRRLQLLGGARMLDLTTEVKLRADGDISGTPLPGRTAHGEAGNTIWDAVVGIMGRIALGDDKKWFVPYYLDVGTGDSDLTWQGLLGIGYAFGWGDLVGAWRYLDYDLSNDYHVRELTQSGAAIGVTFRF
jgi:hypothetical protein